MAQPTRHTSTRDLAALLVAAVALSLLPSAALAQPTPVENPADACPDAVNPPAPFLDRNQIPQVHRLNVDCAYNNDIAAGFADMTYRPAVTVRRDQFASFMVRTMRAADAQLPAPSDQGFTDISGNVHADNINILAETGVTLGTSATTYSPRMRLRRDQIASFVLRAVAYIEDVPLTNLQRNSGPFTDVPASNVHAPNINGARGLNLTIGRTAGTFEPATLTRRDQMASFLVRLLAALGEGIVPAEDRAETLALTPETATNPVASSHTVTATVRDDDDALLADANVRFEVYRDATGSGTFTGPVAQGTQRTNAQGTSGFTYAGPASPGTDRIVACAARPNETCAVTDQQAGTDGIQFTGQPQVDARVDDTATKTWVDSDGLVDRVVFDDDDVDAVNPLGETHTVTVTALDDDGDGPVEGANVRFEVYRAPTADGTFTGPVEESSTTTDADGRATFSYSHDEEAVDRIVVCIPEEGTCQVTDDDLATAGIQFTGDPQVGAERHAVASKRWGQVWPAVSLTASAYGLSVDLLGATLIDEVPNVAIELPDPRQAEETDEVLDVPLNPLVDAGVVEVAARGDLDQGFSQGEAEVADVEVAPDALTGDALVTADAIHAVSTSTCPDEGTLGQASAGSQFVNLVVAGVEVPLNPPPNTDLTVPGVAEIVVNEVIPDPAGEGHGFTVRGLRVTLLDGTGGEVILAEAHSSVICEDAPV